MPVIRDVDEAAASVGACRTKFPSSSSGWLGEMKIVTGSVARSCKNGQLSIALILRCSSATHFRNMAVGVVQSNHQFQFVSDLDAVYVGVLHTLAQFSRQVKLCVQYPAFLARVLNHIVPVFLLVDRQRPVLDLSLSLVLADAMARWGHHKDLMNLHQPAVDVAYLESLEQGGESGLQRDRGAKDNGLLWDNDAVLDLVGPDVFDAHGVEEFQGRGLKSTDNSQSLLGVQVVRQLASCNGSF